MSIFAISLHLKYVSSPRLSHALKWWGQSN